MDGEFFNFGEPNKKSAACTVISTREIPQELVENVKETTIRWDLEAEQGKYFTGGRRVWYTKSREKMWKNGTEGGDNVKKKELLAGAALLSISSALCLKVMKKVGDRLKKAEKSGTKMRKMR